MEFFLTIHKNRNWGWVKQPCGQWRVDSFTTAMLCTGTMGVVYFNQQAHAFAWSKTMENISLTIHCAQLVIWDVFGNWNHERCSLNYIE